MKKRYSLTQQEIEIVQLRRKVAKYESDSERVTLIEKYETEIKKRDRQIERLKENTVKAKEHYESKIAYLKEEIITVKKQSNEYFIRKNEIEKRYEALREHSEFIRRQWKADKEKIAELNGLLFEKDRIISEKEDLIDRLKIRINKNSENSSLSSSMDRPYHKRANVFNGRIGNTGKKAGGQKGHKHYARRNNYTGNTVIIPPTQEMLTDKDLYKTKESISKKVIGLRFCVEVTNYVTPIYRSRTSGARIHAPFPQSISDEITYDSGIEAIILWLTNYCNVSIRKVQNFISEITEGQISPSVGYINGLLKKFGKRSEKEYNALYNKLLTSKVMNLDSTACNVNGKSKRIFIFTNGTEAYFAYRDGHGIKDMENTPIDGYSGALVHDHEMTFYRYGDNSQHQECIAHILRYLKAAIEENSDLTWHRKMHEFFTSLIQKYHTSRESIIYENVIGEFKNILSIGRREYIEHPPSKYLREGEKLLTRLENFTHENFLFLRNADVPYTNNISERLLRNIKRKAKQAVAFRSPDSVRSLCVFSSIIESAKMKQLSPFLEIVALLNT